MHGLVLVVSIDSVHSYWEALTQAQRHRLLRRQPQPEHYSQQNRLRQRPRCMDYVVEYRSGQYNHPISCKRLMMCCDTLVPQLTHLTGLPSWLLRGHSACRLARTRASPAVHVGSRVPLVRHLGWPVGANRTHVACWADGHLCAIPVCHLHGT